MGRVSAVALVLLAQSRLLEAVQLHALALQDAHPGEDGQSETLADVIRRLGSNSVSDGKLSSDDKAGSEQSLSKDDAEGPHHQHHHSGDGDGHKGDGHKGNHHSKWDRSAKEFKKGNDSDANGHRPEYWDGEICSGPCCQHEKWGRDPKILTKVVMTDGCSGSTAIMEIAEAIHREAALGSKNADSIAVCHERREVLQDLHDDKYNFTANYKIQDRLTDKFLALINNTRMHGRTLLFKEQASFVLDSDRLTKWLHKFGKVSLFLRWNLFDLMLCDIKDGIGVAKDIGTCETCGQFRGRGKSSDGKLIKEQEDATIKLSHHKVMDGLSTLNMMQKNRINWMAENFPPDDDDTVDDEKTRTASLVEKKSRSHLLEDVGVKSEDLFAFEWSLDNLDLSVAVWQTFLHNMGSFPGEKVISKILKERAETRDPPKAHKDLIENFDVIEKMIEKCTDDYDKTFCQDLESMVRH